MSLLGAPLTMNFGSMSTIAPSTPPKALTTATTTPTLRAVPPPIVPQAPTTLMRAGFSIAGLGAAIRQNIATERSAPATPTATNAPNVGQPGSANTAGNIAGASGNMGYSLDTLRSFQASNPRASLVLRIGLPVVGVYLMTQGQPITGAVVAGVGAVLWLKR